MHFGSEETGKIKNQASKFTEISRTKAVRKMIQRLIQQLQRHIKIQQSRKIIITSEDPQEWRFGTRK